MWDRLVAKRALRKYLKTTTWETIEKKRVFAVHNKLGTNMVITDLSCIELYGHSQNRRCNTEESKDVPPSMRPKHDLKIIMASGFCAVESSAVEEILFFQQDRATAQTAKSSFGMLEGELSTAWDKGV
ncbi:Peroxisomal adenine nucleotide carrier 1 [Folsomia candida]|uniref:Peroxisomal adenine nucleotide carrier 1 n=1 Tax=Folsomia candida TaxID=158441 RepID=A0A226E9C0_FOLCA|nr:Peroxisomal adenine nucleotide carrier 1 [Folsomia candida]